MRKGELSKVKCFACQQMGHISHYCPEKQKGQMSQARAIPSDMCEETPLEKANTWLCAVGGESDKVKNLILQMMWKDEDFPDA